MVQAHSPKSHPRFSCYLKLLNRSLATFGFFVSELANQLSLTQRVILLSFAASKEMHYYAVVR
jgi:hypothetical protein